MRERSTPHYHYQPTRIQTRTDNLQEAAWIMHNAKEQDLSGISLQLKDGKVQLEFVFTDDGACRIHHVEYFSMRDREPEVWARNIEAGLSKLNRYLSGTLTCGRLCPALNKEEAGR